MSILDTARQLLVTLRWLKDQSVTDQAVWPDVERYKVLRAYYESQDLYQRIGFGTTSSGATAKSINGLRNPARRVVEFHASHLFPGTLPEALPIKTDNARIKPAIEQIWQWSNWNARKQVYARWITIRDTYIKVAQKEDGRPYFQLIESCYVPERKLDERGFVTYVRVTYPVQIKEGTEKKTRHHTEVWDKDNGTYRRWLTDDTSENIEDLGPPEETATLEAFGIDFVPFVWVPFEEVGPGIPSGSFEPYLEKIDEANQVATRLHDMLFRYDRAVWALTRRGFGPDGRELPAPRVTGVFSQSWNPTTDEWSGTGDERSEPGERTIGNDPFLRLPSNVEIDSLVPQINYSDALEILQAMEEEMHQDMPELLYPETKNTSTQESGVALRFRLAPAIDRAVEARGNAEAGIIRADQMALTMAANAPASDVDLSAFRNIGTFDAGDFEHTFEERDIIALSPREELELEEMRVRIHNSRQQGQLRNGTGDEDFAAGTRTLIESAIKANGNGSGSAPEEDNV